MVRPIDTSARRYAITFSAVDWLRELVQGEIADGADAERLRDVIDAAVASAEDEGHALAMDDGRHGPQMLVPIAIAERPMFAVIRDGTVVTLLSPHKGAEVLERNRLAAERRSLRRARSAGAAAPPPTPTTPQPSMRLDGLALTLPSAAVRDASAAAAIPASDAFARRVAIIRIRAALSSLGHDDPVANTLHEALARHAPPSFTLGDLLETLRELRP